MSKLISRMQTINSTEGNPLFVVIPYQDYLRFYEKVENLIPHEVVSLMVQKQLPPIQAWREYFKLTSAEVAERMGITQATFAKMEAGKVKLRKSTLNRIAMALNITVDQLNV